MKTLLPPLILTLSFSVARALSPDVSFWQKALSPEPPGQFESSQDAQVAVAGQTVHVSYFSVVTLDNYNSANTNRLYYRRSLDGGQTFAPPVVLSEAYSSPSQDQFGLALPNGSWRQMTVDGDTVHILGLRQAGGGGWYYILDYFRSTNGGTSFEQHTNFAVGGSAVIIENPAVVAEHGKVTIAYGYRNNDNNHTWMNVCGSMDGGATFPVSTSIDLAGWTGWYGALADLTRSGDHIGLVWQNGYNIGGSYAWSYNAYAAASTNGGTNFTVSLLSGISANGHGEVDGFHDLHAQPVSAWAGTNFYVVWTGLNTNDYADYVTMKRVFLARSTNAGASFEPQRILSDDLPTGSGIPRGGHVSVAAGGNYVYVTFTTVNGRIFLKRSIDAGVTFQPIQEIGDGNSTTLGGGWWHLVKTDPNVADGSKVHIFTTWDGYRYSSDGGATFSAPVHLSTYFDWNGDTGTRSPQCAVDAGGQVHVVFHSYFPAPAGGAPDWDVFYRNYQPAAGPLSANNQALLLQRSADNLRRDNLQIPGTPAFAFSNAMTVEMWVRPDTNCSQNSLLLQRESSADSRGAYRLQTHAWAGLRRPSAKLLTTTGMVELWGGRPINDNEWHHFALTFDAATNVQNARLYVDGYLDVTADVSGTLNPVGGLIWVGGPSELNDKFSGAVDEIRFWNRALTLDEIRQRNSQPLTGAEPGLAAYYPLDGSTREASGKTVDGVLMYQESFIPGVALVPVFTSASLVGAQQDVAALHRVVADFASGYTAESLPSGLTLDGATGLITGTTAAAGVFDVLITATNGFGRSATQILRFVVNASANILFREDFNHGLSANWDAVMVDSNYFAFQPGLMDVRANNGETYQNYNRAVNLFAYSNFVSGDFMLTLGVARYEPAAVNYNRLCLAVWDDYDNNVRFDYGYGNGRGLELVGEQAQVVTGGSLPVDFTNQPFLLRLVKRGGGASDLYTAYYSTNGVDFLAFANNSVANGNGQPSKLGFWFGDDPNLSTHAWLDYFEVVALPPATNMQAYTDTFTPGSGAASWRVQNNAKLYTIDQSQGALAMSKASGGGGGGGEWAVAYSAVTASGDFDVRADYREAGLTYTGGGWGNQIQLNVVYGGQAFCVVRGNEPNYGGNNAHVWDSQAGGQGIVAASDTNGTLRVIRTGTLMKGYHNNTFLWQRTCNTNLATIYLSLQNNGTADPISVKFDNFHVSAQAAMLAAPAFTSAALTAGMLGSPFVWQVTADYWSGLSAAGLPPGLIMNASGLITGTPTGGGAFNATITATNAQVATTQPLRIVISDGVGMLWREDFNNGLAANWTTLPTDASYYSFPPGQMNLRANYGDTWTYYNRPLNLFALNTPTAGDFMVTLGVSKYDLGDRNYPGIFLVAWDDTDNNVRLGYQASTGSRSSSVSIESGQTMTYSAGTSIDFATNAFVLRLVKQGNLYSGWWSTNGTDFLSLGGAVPAPYGNGLPAQVGFWMGVDPTLSDTMLIDYFEVSALTMTNAGTPPVFASANLTGALQGAPFAWEVNADYATGFGASGLPPGLAIGPGGLLTGTPAASGVYDSIVTATNAFGSANQTLRIVVRNPTGVLFRDDFSSGLSSSWTTVPSDTSYFNLLPGQMRARADYGEAWSSINRPLHLFAVDAPTNDDFTITLGVSKFVPNHADSPQVGVIAWQDTDNYVRSIYYGSYWGPSSQGQMVIEQGASPIPTQFPLAFGDQPFLLRLQRTNGVYTSSWSTNGVDFTFNPGTASSATLAPTKLGFYLGGDPTFLSVAVVDHFELASGAANPVAPPPPLLQFLRASSDTIAFSWSAAAGYNYQVQYTTNLGTGPWLNLGGPLPGNNGTLSVSNTVNLARQRFYRLLAQ